MKSNLLRTTLCIVFFPFLFVAMLHAQCPTGLSTKTGNLGSTFLWNGPTASTVTVSSLTTSFNSLGEQVVVSDIDTNTSSFMITKDSCVLTEEIDERWLKNGGHTGNGDSVDHYVGRVQLTFSNPVPAKEVFVAIINMGRRGIPGEAPDGFIRFSLPNVSSVATPANFRMVTLSRGAGSTMNQVNNYNVDGSGNIIFGITSFDSAANRYIGLMSDDTETVSAVNIFIRNISDDVGFYVGAINPASPLPLSLIDFTGKATENANLLSWTTANEINTSEFIVERSNNGKNGGFTEAGKVYSANLSQYQFVDKDYVTGTNFYRLKIMERDGSYTYSPVISVTGHEVSDHRKIFPNPLKGNTFQITDVEAIKDVTLYDLSGRIIGDVSLTPTAGGANVSIYNASLPKGFYIVHYKTVGNFVGKAKLLIQ